MAGREGLTRHFPAENPEAAIAPICSLPFAKFHHLFKVYFKRQEKAVSQALKSILG